MKKKKRNKKRNTLIFIGILLIYIGIMAYLMLTVNKPTELIVESGATELVMDGVSKTALEVKVLDSNGNPMSGQSIAFKLVTGSGKVTTILGVTSDDGIALGEYQTGYGKEAQTAEISVENITGLLKIVQINEYPSNQTPNQIVIEADTTRSDILKNGLEIYATVLDTSGVRIPNHKLLFKVEKGSVGFYGFKMMAMVTDSDGKAMRIYSPAAAGDVVISVTSEEASDITATISFSVK